MPGTVDIEFLEKVRAQIGTLVTEDARKLPSLRYCDVRMQVKEEKGAAAENGVEKMSAEDYTFDFGVRVIAGAKASAPGYYGRLLGNADVDNIASGSDGRHQGGPPEGYGQRPDEGPRPRAIR